MGVFKVAVETSLHFEKAGSEVPQLGTEPPSPLKGAVTEPLSDTAEKSPDKFPLRFNESTALDVMLETVATIWPVAVPLPKWTGAALKVRTLFADDTAAIVTSAFR